MSNKGAGSNEARFNELMNAGQLFVDSKAFVDYTKGMTDQADQFLISVAMLLRAVSCVGATFGNEAVLEALSVVNGTMLQKLMGDGAIELKNVVVHEIEKPTSPPSGETVH